MVYHKEASHSKVHSALAEEEKLTGSMHCGAQEGIAEDRAVGLWKPPEVTLLLPYIAVGRSKGRVGEGKRSIGR